MIKSSSQNKNTGNVLNKEISLFGKQFKDQKKVEIFTELNILLSSGIDIRTALEIVIANQTKESDKETFIKLKNSIIGGKSLSEAIKETERFSNYDCICMQIGEETGKLNEILSEVAQFYSFKIKHKRQLYNSLSYPLMVLFISIAAVLFMMNFIVPMFSEVFKRFGGELPAITQLIINTSTFLQNNILILLLLLTSFILSIILNRKKPWFRNYSSNIIIRTPIFGKIINKIYLARFCQSMALLTGAKVPMIHAISLVKQMIGFYPYEIALSAMSDDILKGKLLHESMTRFKIFEIKIVSLIKVAEEVNQLDIMFKRLNKQYSEDVESSIGLLTTFLEPALIIFVGILVATILVSMYLPLFQMSSSFM